MGIEQIYTFNSQQIIIIIMNGSREFSHQNWLIWVEKDGVERELEGKERSLICGFHCGGGITAKVFILLGEVGYMGHTMPFG